MNRHSLGRVFRRGDIIFKEKEVGDCAYVILSGQAEVLTSLEGRDVQLGVLEKGDVFGEMAIFKKEVRSATVRALSDIRVMPVDKKVFLQRIHEDPSFVYAIFQKLSERIRDLNTKYAQCK